MSRAVVERAMVLVVGWPAEGRIRMTGREALRDQRTTALANEAPIAQALLRATESTSGMRAALETFDRFVSPTVDPGIGCSVAL